MQATTIWREARGKVEEGIVCPAQSGDTTACATCALCWSPWAGDQRIVFLGHGMSRSRGPRKRRVSTETPRQSTPEPVLSTPIAPQSTRVPATRAVEQLLVEARRELAWLREAQTIVENLIATYERVGHLSGVRPATDDRDDPIPDRSSPSPRRRRIRWATPERDAVIRTMYPRGDKMAEIYAALVRLPGPPIPGKASVQTRAIAVLGLNRPAKPEPRYRLHAVASA